MASASKNPEVSDATRAILDEIISGGGHDYTLDQLLAAKREAEEKLNPFAGHNPADKKFFNFALMNLQRDYEQMLALTSVVGYLFCMSEEHFVRDAKMYKDPAEAKATVLKFLNHFFEYNPNQHVAELRKKAPSQEARDRLRKHTARVREMAAPEKREECAAAVDKFQRDVDEHARALEAQMADLAALESEKDDAPRKAAALDLVGETVKRLDLAKAALAKGRELQTKAKRYGEISAAYDKRMPYDTFYWFSAYFRSNYPALREAAEALYPVRSFLEEMLIVYPGAFDEEGAKTARLKLGGERLPIHTGQLGVPIVYGPTKDNIDRTEFAGEGWEVFKSIIAFHQREADMGQAMLQQISKVRRARENVATADPAKVAEFSQFCEALREADRPLTQKEQAVLAAESAREDDGVSAELDDAVAALRREREAIEDAAAVADIPDDCLATQLVGTNPDTGAIVNSYVYFKSEEAQAAAAAAARDTAAATAPTIIQGE